jgi:putative ABC transport system permease protein
MFQWQHDGAKIHNRRGLERMWQDLRYAMRQLRLAKGFAAVVIFTLALGIGANTAMFSLVNAWLLRPLPLKDPQSLVAVWRSKLGSPKDPAYFPFYRDYLVWSSAQGRTLQSLAGTFEQSYVLTGAGDPRRVQGAVATWNLFSTVGATAQIGRLFQPGDEKGEPECVISHVLWAEQFHSSPDVLMRTLTLNDKPYRVIGVLPPTFSLRVLDRSFETDVWTLIPAGDPNYSNESWAAVAVIGRLNPGVTLAQAQADLFGIQRLLNTRFSDEPPESGVLVVRLQEDNTRTIRSSLMLLFGAVAVLLLIACVNAGSLILGRHAQRAREFAVRVAMGCSAGRLLQQLTIEVLVLFGAGGIAGLLIAWILLRAFVAWSPLGVLPAGGVSLDPLVLAGTAGVVGFAALLFGSLPALRSLRSLDGDALRSKTTLARAQVRARAMFVATEISLSVILLVTAGLLISTFIRIGSEPLGFETQQVFVTDIALPYSKYQDVAAQSRFGEELSRRLQQLPTVRAAGVALSWPFNVDGLSAVEILGQAEAKIEMLPQVATFQIGQGYLEALGVALLRGRSFSGQDLGHSLPVAVINDEMARRYFAGQDPIGQRIRLRFHDEKPADEPWLTIVGVAGSTRSVRYNQIQWDRYPVVYTSLFQRKDRPGSVHNSNALTLYIYLEAPYPVEASAMAAAVHGLDPNLSISPLRSTGEIVSSLRSQPRVRAILLGSFALLTLVLAAVGVYGVMTQLAEQRRRDFGIRIALGASASNIRSLVVRRALGLTGLGLGLGLFGAAIATRLLSGFLYGISALNPSIFAVVIVVLGAVAIIASYFPARRAAKVDPLETLRSE